MRSTEAAEGGAERLTDPTVGRNAGVPPKRSVEQGALRDPDRAIRCIAAGQRGVVSRTQLLRAGVPSHVIDYRLSKGRLEPLHRGVYRVGPAAVALEREMAAVLACGASAVLSHWSAACLWDLRLPGSRAAGAVEVSAWGGRRGARIPGVRLHRISDIRDDERTRFEGVPVTTPARTLVDVAGSASGSELERALARAFRLDLARPAAIRALLEGRPGRPGRRGAARLRRMLTASAEPSLTRSRAEAELLGLVRRAGLGRPETNVIVCGHEVDFLWREKRLVVEVDGFEFHRSRSAFEQDRRRNAALQAAGFRVMPVTWRKLVADRELLVAELAQALAR